MTVAELIDLLKPIADKGISLMIDCPHCGKANELADVRELVVLGMKPKEHRDD